MIKKVLLINPPESGMGDHSFSPLGLLYIGAILKKNSISVKIVDGFISSMDEIKEAIKDYSPDMVGITCHTYARTKALEIARSSKDIAPEIKVVLGGAHPTIMGRQILENFSFVDFIVAGEGDHTLLELCQGKEHPEIKGLGYRKGDKVFINPEREVINDLDSIPFPAWELIDLKLYPSDGEGIFRGIDLSKESCIPVIFSRGCVGDCNFCSNRLMWKRWRHRSPDNMLEELKLLNKDFGIKRFVFNDDCFSVNKKATIELCNKIVESGINIVFDIVTRTDCIDKEVLEALKNAGCYQINFGIETASPSLLKIMKKPIPVKVSEEAIRLTNSFGIKTTALLIAGCVGETYETINETIDFLNNSDPSRIGVGNGLMIFPGTRLYELSKEQKVIDDSFWLTDYSWKVYTFENSRMWLNIFGNAIDKRKKLSRYRIVNLMKNHRFVSKEIEYRFKDFLIKMRLKKERIKTSKYKFSY
ncbi:MAG: radical SAM protein [Candidatus Omnitrophota bacterium]